MYLKRFLFITLFFILISCNDGGEDTSYMQRLEDPELFQASIQNLTNIVVYDIFSPPVASRVYLYPTIAAYEVARKATPLKYNSLVGQVKGLAPLPESKTENVNHLLASIYAFNHVGKALIFSEKKMEAFQADFAAKIKEIKVPRSIDKASKAYGIIAANLILDWASKDLYSQTRTYPKYSMKEEDRFWKPTPPDYMDGIEPHWEKIRTMVLDSSNQFT